MTKASEPVQAFEHAARGGPEQVADFQDAPPGLLKRLQHWLHETPSGVPMIVLFVSLMAFAVLIDGTAILQRLGLAEVPEGANPENMRFFSPFALTLILQQVAIVGIVGAAQSLVVLTKGIDLSVGAMMVLSSVVMGLLTFRYGLHPVLAILCGFAVGAACGFINGWLVAHMRLPPFIVTLGTWQIFLATNFLFSANETIRAQDIAAAAPILQFFGTRINIGGAVFTYGVIAMLVLVLILAYALRQTAWGRHVYAVGDDPEAAELAGVRVRRVLISVYTLSGLICALAGWALIGRIGSVSPTSGQEANIESITAVVIGGISLFGGRGSIMGMLFGALIVGVFSLGLRLMGTDPQWTFMMIGFLIIIAVAVDQWIRKVSA